MSSHNFKSIPVVPPAKDFIDIVLSKTQRQTPTVVHPGYAIQRIRAFYMRKVKYTASLWHEKLEAIVTAFPKVDDVHPFYGDLLNVLYDKDHYKLALGQLSVAKKLIDNLASDYVRLLKYGDSLYRCKQLKRAAMGRMCTLMKRQAASLAYLEQVRQHMSRLPSIDPHTRTLLVCGYPNVGKSSFVNSLSRADVEVQPYAFTTKSLYVGHFDYKYLRWQVLDTPGILDRPLDERNTIEMQAITAMAHLRAAVVYVIDLSEQCGYSLEQQAALFHSIKPLFANKPVLIAANKVDVRTLDELPADSRKIVDDLAAEALRLSHGGTTVLGGAGSQEHTLLCMSTLREEGVQAVKNVACDRLIGMREQIKLASKRAPAVCNRLHIAVPKARDTKARPPCIPASVVAERAQHGAAGQKAGAVMSATDVSDGSVVSAPAVLGRRTEKDLQEEGGGAGVYSSDLRKRYLLEDDTWRYDIVPEILDGHNIADFIDPEIDAKLAELEREEELLERVWQQQAADMSEDSLDDDDKALLARIRHRKAALTEETRVKKRLHGNNAVVPRSRRQQKSLSELRGGLEDLGMDAGAAVERVRSQSRGRRRERSVVAVGSKRGRQGVAQDVDMLAADGAPASKKRLHSSRSRSMARGRSQSLAAPSARDGVKDEGMRNKAVRMADTSQKLRNRQGRRGDADRQIPTKKPKHLFSGKRGIGKTDRR